MRYILVTGGELGNKGAQAMTFITVSEIRKKYPNHGIVLVSYNDYKLPREEKERYGFSIETPSSMAYPLYHMGGVFKLVSILGRHTQKEQVRLDELYGNADVLIDVSGYALGSNWGEGHCLNYLNSVLVAKAYDIRCFLMPQSFGPFDFKGAKGLFVEWLIKKLLRHPEVIYAREKEGADLLRRKYGLKNVLLSCDLVLNNKSELKLGDIYKMPPELNLPLIRDGSVGIVPNAQNFKYGDRNVVVKIYESIVEQIVASGRHVYLLRHSAEDLEICHEIKNSFSAHEKVIVLDGDFSCFDFNVFVGKFDFLIASRFHSVVHAYKNCVPCIVLGWAVKYAELAALFDQTKFVFDVREELDTASIVQAVQNMSINWTQESETICGGLSSLQEKNVYDVMSAN